MSEPELNIDESAHQYIPTLTERLTHALTSILLGFALVHLIGFWMFGGMRMGSIYGMSYLSFIMDLVNIYVLAFLAICGVMGWFKGEYFLDRLKGFLNFWRFW